MTEVDCFEKLYGISGMNVPHYRKNTIHILNAVMNSIVFENPVLNFLSKKTCG